MTHTDFYRGLEAGQQALRQAGPEPQHRAAAVHHALQPLLDHTADLDRRACRAGCDACCHFPVGVTFAEAQLLVAAVAGDAALAAAIRQAAATTAAEPWARLAGRPCPLLQAGRCAVYHARPLPCRALASSDAAACAAALRGPAEVPLDGDAFWRGLGAAAALAEAGPVTGSRELRAAVAALLAAPEDAAAAFRGARPAGGDPGSQ